MFCPNCGNPTLSRFPANRPVADFFCEGCGDEYELKSQAKSFGRKVADGAYKTKIERLASDNAPNLVLLQYDRQERQVRNLRVVPRFFFVPSMIERRKPLGPTARRAGWVGSNILLERIPESGRVPVIAEGLILERSTVLEAWKRLRFLEARRGDARGWLLAVMNSVEQIGKSDFSLSEVYAFENDFKAIFPQNNNVRPKIRQQLQVPRDAGRIEFLGKGRYRTC